MTRIGGTFWPTITAPTAIIGTLVGTTLTGVALTSAYQANSTDATTIPTHTFDVGSYPKCNLDITYVTGATETGTTLCWKVEDSFDRTNFYRLQNETVSSGTSTLADREWQHAGGAGTTTYKWSIGIDMFYRYGRISFKESGVSANVGNVNCIVTLAGA